MKQLTQHLDRNEQHDIAQEFRLNDTRTKLESYPLKGSIRLGTRRAKK